MIPSQLIDQYLAGENELRAAIAGMTAAELDARPILGKWSTRQVICHLADFEPIYADRMKRVIAENNPTMFGGDPDCFAEHLAYDKRDVEEDLEMIAALRRHVARILITLEPEDFQRQGVHAEDGPITLHTLLERIVNHVPHHIRFIQEKRTALGK